MFARFFFFLFCFLIPLTEVFAAQNLPIPAGTKLIYTLQWSFFPVGEAVMSVDGPIDFEGQKAYTLNIKVRTNGFADTFYKVRNESTSWLNEDWSKSLHFESNQHEGSHDRESLITFNWESMFAQYSNYGKAQEPVELKGPCFDPFGVSLGVCRMPLIVGETVTVDVTNGKKMMVDQINVVKKERIRVPLGRVDTVLVEPGTEDLGGVFKRSEGATMRIWLSADAYQIPVRLQSEVSVGSFWGELVRVEGPLAGYFNLPEDSKPKPIIRRGGRRR
jgi:hypothetical protein